MPEPRLAAVVHHLRQLSGSPAGGPLTDGQLLQRFAASHEESAFAALLERHGRLVWGVCRHVLRHTQDAEDAFQATFLVLARKAASVRKQESVASWLHGVAYRVALKARTRAAARRARERPAERAAPPGPPAEAALRELQTLLDEEVSRLPAKLRAPFVLCCLQGRSKGEAARELGWKEGTVSGRLAEARERLRARLARRGVALAAGLTAAALAHGSASAAVPAALSQAATAAALGRGCAPSVAALAKEVTRTMFLSRLKTVAATLLLIAAGAVGTAVAARGPGGDPPVVPPESSDPLPARPADQPAAPPAEARPQAQAAPHLDILGDPLPPGALARFGTTRLRHGGTVNAVAFAPDGKSVAAAGQDSVVRLWDPATGKLLHSWRGHTGYVRCLAFSPDGQLLASGGQDKVIRLWKTAAVKQTEEAPPTQAAGHEETVMSLAFSRDGKTLYSGGWDGSIRAWEPATGKELRRFDRREGRVRSVALTPDGKTLASAQLVGNVPFKGTVHLWDAATGRHLRPLGPELKEISEVAFSPDGETLAVAADQQPRLYEVASGDELHKGKKWPGSGAYCVAFSPDGKTLACGSTGRLRLVQVATGRELRQFEGDHDFFYSAAFAPDGKTLACGSTRTLGLWDPATGKERFAFAGHAGPVGALLFSPDGKRLITGGYGPTLRQWDADTAKEVGTLKGGPNWNDGAVLSPDGKTLAVVGSNLAIILIDTATGREPVRFTDHLPPRTSAVTPVYVAFSRDGKTVASATMGVDHHVRVWDAATGKQRLQIDTGKENNSGLALSPDGKTIYSASLAGAVRVWDAVTGAQLRTIGRADHGAVALTLSRDGRLLAGIAGAGVQVWDAATGELVRELPDPRDRLSRLAFSPDGRTLALYGGDRPSAAFWEIASGRLRFEVGGHAGAVKGVAFAPDGRRLATGGEDTTALLWDLRALALADGPAVAELSPRRLNELWAALGGSDARDAYRAMTVLAGRPAQAVPFIKERLTRAEPKRLDQLLADLDNDSFEVRERATSELMALGKQVEPALRKAATSGSAEVRLRVEAILRHFEQASADDTRRLLGLRALEVLEAAGTPEARRVIAAVAEGAPEAELTREAKAALARLK